MNTKRIAKIDKHVMIAIITCLLVLSYLLFTAALQIRLGEDASASRNSYVFIFLLVSFVLFGIFHKNNSGNFILWLLFGWLIIGYFIASPYGLFSTAINALRLTLWIICFSFGVRLSKIDDDYSRFFIHKVNLIIILPLSLLGIITFFTTDLIFNQQASDCFFAIMVYFPFVLMLEEKKTQKIILFLSMLIIAFVSMKRSLIISFVVCSLIYSLLTDHKRLFSKWYFWVLFLGVVLLSHYLYGIVSETLISRFTQLEDDGGTGREYIYKTIINSLQESDVFDLVMGHGFMSVAPIVGRQAHSDLLELLFDYGIIGASLYLLFLLSLVNCAIRGYRKRKVNKTLYAAFISTLVFYIILSATNCFIYVSMFTAPIMLALGLQSGLLKANRNNG